MQVLAHRPLGLGTRARPCGPLPMPPALLRSLSLLHLESPGRRISALGATLGRRTLFYSHTVGKEGNGPKEAEGMSGEATGVPSTCGLWGARGGRGWTGRTGRGQDPYLPARLSVHLLVQRSLSGYDGPEPAGGEKPRTGIILVRLFLETAQTQRLILSSVCFAGDGAEAQEALGSPRLGGKWEGGRRPSFHKGRRPHHLFLGRGARRSVADGPASFLVLRGVPISRPDPTFLLNAKAFLPHLVLCS